MTINSQIVDQRVRKIVETYSESFTSEVGIKNDPDKMMSAAFVFLVLKTIIDLPDDQLMDCVVEGGQDFGIDAIFVGPPADGEFAITVLQGKYRRDPSNESAFPENGIKALLFAISRVFDPFTQISVNQRLRDRLEEARSLVADGNIPTVHAIMCNNGLPPTSRAMSLTQNKNTSSQVTWQYIGPDQLLELLQKTKPVNEVLQLSGKALIDNFDFRRVLLGKIAVGQLSALFERHGDRLLERNIRRYLGLTGNRVNEAVAGTLQDPDQRKNFYFYNNGITMICSQIRYNALQQENWQVQIDGMQIVNGGQTSKTVQQVMKSTPDAAEAQVLIRVYELAQDDEELVRSITYATNSQNPVDLRDLRSNDLRQKQLEEGMRQLGYIYRRQRFDQATSSKELTSAVVAESVLAVWRERPHQSRFLTTEHFGKLYDIIFTQDLNAAQAVTASLLNRVAENRRKRPGSDSPDFLPYASRFISMLMGQYLLSDMDIKLEKLDHRNFSEAEQIIDRMGNTYFRRAITEISAVIDPMFPPPQNRSLQKLSATFRRGDLVNTLFDRG